MPDYDQLRRLLPPYLETALPPETLELLRQAKRERTALPPASDIWPSSMGTGDFTLPPGAGGKSLLDIAPKLQPPAGSNASHQLHAPVLGEIEQHSNLAVDSTPARARPEQWTWFALQFSAVQTG